MRSRLALVLVMVFAMFGGGGAVASPSSSGDAEAVSSSADGLDLDQLEFVPTAPCAVFDSRSGTGAWDGPFDGGESRTAAVTGSVPASQGAADCEAPPEDAVAVSLNLVALSATGSGNLQLSAAGVAPEGGVVNFTPGINNSNAVPVEVDASGQVDVRNNSGSSVDVRGVVLGYYVPALLAADPQIVLDGPDDVVVGSATEGFSAQVFNAGEVDLDENVEVQFTIGHTDALSEGDVALEYHDGDDWVELTLSEDDGELTGRFGPADGFPIDADYDATTQLRATFEVAGDYTTDAELVGIDTDDVYDTDTLGTRALPDPYVLNVSTDVVYDSIQAAVDAAGEGHTLEAYGDFAEGTVTVDVADLTVAGVDGASVSGSFRVTADGVTISGFAIADYETVLNEVAGIYLDGAADVTIDGVSLDGDGVAGASRAVVTTGDVTGTVVDSTFVDNTTGVSNNPGSALVIDGNTFTGNVAGVGTDSADGVTVTNNTFAGNGEGVGLGAANVTVTGNTFQASNDSYICDYIDHYDLQDFVPDNTFEAGPFEYGDCLVGAMPDPAVHNVTTNVVYDSIQAAVDAAAVGDVLEAYGAFAEGVVVVDESVTIVGVEDASVSGSFRVAADGVTISGFAVSDYETVLGEIAGIYLDGVADVTIDGVSLDGDGVAGASRAVVTTGVVTGTVSDSTFDNNTTGVSNNPGSALVIDGNTFTGNVAGVGTDSADGVTITNNTFDSNGEGVGLGAANVTVTGNTFTGNTAGIVSYVDVITDATENWWGAEGGPDHPDNPNSELGDAIIEDSGTVLYEPWCTSSDCSTTSSVVLEASRITGTSFEVVWNQEVELRTVVEGYTLHAGSDTSCSEDPVRVFEDRTPDVEPAETVLLEFSDPVGTGAWNLRVEAGTEWDGGTLHTTQCVPVPAS